MRGGVVFMKVILDCDNTFGINGYDLDDGLALIYLLGCKDVELLGITCTFGNHDVETVYQATIDLLMKLNRTDIPVFLGESRSPDLTNGYKNSSSTIETQKVSQAVDFLLDAVHRENGAVNLLATGSLTNLAKAFEVEPLFFEKIEKLVIMGGITEPLRIQGRFLSELNFSVNPAAASLVLEQGKRMAIATGNHCLKAYFSKRGLEKRLTNPMSRFLYEHSLYWYEWNQKHFGMEGFYNWDVVAAVFMIHPEYFDQNPVNITPDLESLKSGMLLGNGEEIQVSLPNLIDSDLFEEHVYQTYFQVKV